MKIWTWKFKQNLTHECSNQLINLYLHKLMGLYEALLPPLKSYLLFFSLFCTTFRKIFIKMRVWTTFIPPPLPPPFNAFHFCLHFEFVWSPLILKKYIFIIGVRNLHALLHGHGLSMASLSTHFSRLVSFFELTYVKVTYTNVVLSLPHF